MKTRELKCGICRKDIVLGQAIKEITWKSLGGGGGDYIDDNRMIVHSMYSCASKALEQAFNDEHPYGSDGVDLGAM